MKTEEAAGEPIPAAAGEPPLPASGERGRSRRREGLAVFGVGYLVHAALALVMQVPIVMYDEYGYFATARHLVGEGQATHLRYHPGYAFVLMPAFLVTSSSEGAYHVAAVRHQRPARRAHDVPDLAPRAGAGAGRHVNGGRGS